MKYDTLAVEITKAVGAKLQTYLVANVDIPVFFEESQPEDVEQDNIEIRFDGLDIDEIANTQYLIEVSVDLLLTFKMRESIFDRLQILSKMAEALREDFPIYLDGALVGCLSTAIPFGGSEKIKTINYGKVNKDRRLLHSAVSTTLHLSI